MPQKDPISRFHTLTDRPKKVLELVCPGLQYKDIGAEFYISERKVKAHMGNIYMKLELNELPNNKRIAALFEMYCKILEKDPLPSEPMAITVLEDQEPIAENTQPVEFTATPVVIVVTDTDAGSILELGEW